MSEWVVVCLDSRDGEISASTLSWVRECQSRAQQAGYQTGALVIGPGSKERIEKLEGAGLSRIWRVQSEALESPLNAPHLQAIEQALRTIAPKAAVFPSSESSREMLGALASALDAPALPDLVSYSFTEEGAEGKRPVMASRFLARVSADGTPVLLSVRPGSSTAPPAGGPVPLPEPEIIEVKHPDRDRTARLLEQLMPDGQRTNLAEAEKIVAAGRGVRDPEGVQLIEELAGLLNASIGASRALTESGVFDPSLQIGQTGKVVSPRLYIAVGISGAIQHVAGMINSDFIVAINRDPDAPIFDIADIGLVGDLYKILPLLIEELKKRGGDG
ncbi:MAG: electron transfer flavoprotein subunit alpha/FixB family protein [Balneolaceae bacterium]